LSSDLLKAMRKATSSTSMLEPLYSASEPPLLPSTAIGSKERGSKMEWTERGSKVEFGLTGV
jgi:hypothetical protein